MYVFCLFVLPWSVLEKFLLCYLCTHVPTEVFVLPAQTQPSMGRQQPKRSCPIQQPAAVSSLLKQCSDRRELVEHRSLSLIIKVWKQIGLKPPLCRVALTSHLEMNSLPNIEFGLVLLDSLTKNFITLILGTSSGVNILYTQY